MLYLGSLSFASGSEALSPCIYSPSSGESLKPGHNYGSNWAARKEESRREDLANQGKHLTSTRADAPESLGETRANLAISTTASISCFFQKVNFGEREEVETPG